MTARINGVLRPREWALLGISVATSVLASVMEVVAVAGVGAPVDDLLAGRPVGHSAARLVVVVSCWTLLNGLAIVAGRNCGYGMSAALHESLAAHLLRLPLGWFGPRRHGEVSHLLGVRVMSVMSIPAHLLIPAIRAVIVPLGLIVVMARFDWLAAVVAAVWVPVLALTQWWSARRAAHGDAALASARADSADRVIEYVDGQRTLRLLADTDHATAVVKHSIEEVADRTQEQVESVLGALGIFGLAVQLMLVTVAATGLAHAGFPSGGRTIVFVLATVCLVAALQAAAGLSATIRAAWGSVTAIDDFLAIPALPEPEPPTRAPSRGELVVEDIWVGQDHTNPILKGVGFTAEPGTITAIVGPSGAGKTTLLRALARFFDPYRGRVLIDGVDCRQLGSGLVHERIAMVFQDVELFAGTLEENVVIGRVDASRAELAAAMSAAGMDEMLERLPDGLDTMVGEQGSGVSGGERQRVSVARALLKQAPILLLDEASASLDSHHQHLLEETVTALRGRTTVVLVTHRLESARDADQILVLDGGRLVECGRHCELLEKGGVYAGLWQGRNLEEA